MPPVIITTPFFVPGAGGSDYPAVVLTDGPVGYWRHEDASGNLIDSSGNGHDLTPVGSLTYSQVGQVDNAINYVTGGPSRAEITNSSSANAFDFLGNLTLELWVFPTQIPQQETGAILTKNNGSGGAGSSNYSMEWKGGGIRPRMIVSIAPSTNVNAEMTSEPAVDTWFHLVGVRNDTSLRIYYNGDLEASTTIAGTALRATNQRFTLGAFSEGGFNLGHGGRLDEVAVYSNALTEERVLAHYNAGIA